MKFSASNHEKAKESREEGGQHSHNMSLRIRCEVCKVERQLHSFVPLGIAFLCCFCRELWLPAGCLAASSPLPPEDPVLRPEPNTYACCVCCTE